MKENPVRISFAKRFILRVLAWAMDDVDDSLTHPVNQLLYLRCFYGGTTVPPFTHPQIDVGDHTYGICRECFLPYHPDDRVVIGKFCGIAQGVKFVFGEHSMNAVSTFPFKAVCFKEGEYADSISKGDILIGNDVWIGVNATILSGVRVGDGAVIAAGAVVNKDVAPYSVVGGVPARHIKHRLKEDQIQDLLDIKWWDWPLDKIKDNRELFYGDPAAFISKHQTKD